MTNIETANRLANYALQLSRQEIANDLDFFIPLRDEIEKALGAAMIQTTPIADKNGKLDAFDPSYSKATPRMEERDIEVIATRIMTICEAVRRKHGFLMWSEARKEIQPLLESAING